MKKELKTYIKEHKLSDDDILKLISVKSSPPPESEKDVKDEADEESESQPDSKKTDDTAEKESADEETPAEETETDLAKLVALEVAKALKIKTETETKKKPAPRPSPPKTSSVKPNQFGIRTQ